MATGLGSYTPEQIDMLPLSPAAKAAWKAKLAPAPGPTTVPSLMDVAAGDPGALKPVPPAAPMAPPMGLEAMMSPMAPPPPANLPGLTLGTPALAPKPSAELAPAFKSVPIVPADSAGDVAPPGSMAPPVSGGAAGPPPPPPENPTGYGQPGPYVDPLAKKKAAVLLPGQDAQMQNEMAFAEAQLAKQAEIDAIKVDAQQKIVAEQEGALAAQQQMAAKEAEDRAAFAGYYDGEMGKLQASSDKLANTKVDSHRVFKAQGVEGVFQGVAIAMAMVLGAQGASATGGVNAGVVALEKAVDRDIAMQEKDLQRQEAGLARSNSLLAQKYRIFGDLQQAKAAARMDAWKLAGMRADLIAQQSGAEAAKIGAAKVKEAAERGIARERENWDLSIESKWKQYQMQQAQQAQAAQAAAQAKADKYNDKIMDTELAGAKKVLDEYPGAQVKFVDNHVVIVDPTTGKRLWSGTGGTKGDTVPFVTLDANGEPVQSGGGIATSPAAANKHQEITDAALKGLAVLKEMKAMRAKQSGGVFIASSQEQAKATFLKRQLFTAAKTTGENSDKDAERIEATLPNVLDLDTKAGVTGSQPYTDALIDQWEIKLKNDVARANATYLKNGQAPKTDKQAIGFAPAAPPAK